MSKKETIFRLFGYLLAYRRELVLVLLIMAGTLAISMITPLLMERAVNVHVANKDVTGLLTIGAVSLGMFSLPGRDEGKDGGDGFRVQPGTGDHTSAAL